MEPLPYNRGRNNPLPFINEEQRTLHRVQENSVMTGSRKNRADGQTNMESVPTAGGDRRTKCILLYSDVNSEARSLHLPGYYF